MAGTVYSRLVPLITYNYLLQALGAAIFVPFQTEKYYDTLGAVGFLSSAFLSLYYPWVRARFWESREDAEFPSLTSFAPRQLAITGAMVLWSVRLGTFLLSRILKTGKDSRFDKVRDKPAKFFVYWMMQATWISFVGLPVWLANAVPASSQPPLDKKDYMSLALFAASFALEVVADRQKDVWRLARDQKRHAEQFITSGLWSWSRHPNYVGEVGLWTGIWALAVPALPVGGAAVSGVMSPLLTWYLLRHLSGVPLLESANRKAFKANPKWLEYTKKVPVFFPWGGYR